MIRRLLINSMSQKRIIFTRNNEKTNSNKRSFDLFENDEITVATVTVTVTVTATCAIHGATIANENLLLNEMASIKPHRSFKLNKRTLFL